MPEALPPMTVAMTPQVNTARDWPLCCRLSDATASLVPVGAPSVNRDLDAQPVWVLRCPITAGINAGTHSCPVEVLWPFHQGPEHRPRTRSNASVTPRLVVVIEYENPEWHALGSVRRQATDHVRRACRWFPQSVRSSSSSMRVVSGRDCMPGRGRLDRDARLQGARLPGGGNAWAADRPSPFDA
jgi:hypothetical protein